MAGFVADANARGLDNWTALHFAANNGHSNVVEELLKIPGMDIEPISKSKRTPLHQASMQGNSAIVSQLLEKDINVNCQDDEESTPLHLAS